MQPPKFWYEPPGIRAKLLSPLAAIYARATRKRLDQAQPVQLEIPVICVGNINAGGTGKTPTVIAIVERLTAAGRTPHIVTRGYGGTVVGPMRVSERDDLVEQVGDEALLLSAFAPTWVSRDRGKGGLTAAKAGADVVVLDDGLQNPSLAKDVTVICVDAMRGFGNGLVLPAGPLREPIELGMARGDIVLSVGPEASQEQFRTNWHHAITKPQMKGNLRPLQTGIDWTDQRVLGFAGIGNPEKFFHSLREAGATVVKTEALDDHQPLTPSLMKRLAADAANTGAQLVTTEKDAARLPPDLRQTILTFPVRMEIDDWTPLDDLLAQAF